MGLFSTKKSFLVDVVESPVVVIVGWDAICGKVVLRVPCVVDVRNIVGSNLVTILQQNMDTIIVTDELGDPSSVGIRVSLQLIDPMI